MFSTLVEEIIRTNLIFIIFYGNSGGLFKNDNQKSILKINYFVFLLPFCPAVYSSREEPTISMKRL